MLCRLIGCLEAVRDCLAEYAQKVPVGLMNHQVPTRCGSGRRLSGPQPNIKNTGWRPVAQLPLHLIFLAAHLRHGDLILLRGMTFMAVCKANMMDDVT